MTKTDEVLKASDAEWFGGLLQYDFKPRTGEDWPDHWFRIGSMIEQMKAALAKARSSVSIQPADDAVVERVARAIRAEHLRLRWNGGVGYVSVGLEESMSKQIARAVLAALASPQGEKGE